MSEPTPEVVIDLQKQVIEALNASLATARADRLAWFDRWVEAVRQGTSLSGPRHAHCSISTYEDAWAILGLVGTVTEAKFNEAVARKRAELGGE